MRIRHRRAMTAVWGFTLVELLVVIAIVGLLISILLPALARARRQSHAIKCAAQVRQICLALANYASDHRGYYPPNGTVSAPYPYWYDLDRIGNYLPCAVNAGNTVAGGMMACPEDDNSLRTYAMNIWASAVVNEAVLYPPIRGVLWNSSVRQSSRMLLVVETWSRLGSDQLGHVAPATVGYEGATPGQKFGGAGGAYPPILGGRFGQLICELAYPLHRDPSVSAPVAAAVGKVNIGYADGHVAMKSATDLMDASTGASTGDTLWSPLELDGN